MNAYETYKPRKGQSNYIGLNLKHADPISAIQNDQTERKMMEHGSDVLGRKILAYLDKYKSEHMLLLMGR